MAKSKNNHLKRRKGNVWIFFGIFACLIALVFLVLFDPEQLPGTPCDCMNESYIISDLDSNHQYLLAASISCAAGECDPGSGEASDSSMCQFIVNYQVLIQDWGRSYSVVPNDSGSIWHSIYDPDQEIQWSGGRTEEFGGRGAEGITEGERTYWVKCGERQEFEVQFRTLRPVVTNPYYRSPSTNYWTYYGDSLVPDTLDVEYLEERLNLRTNVVLECGACKAD